jgi:hypothetical protein
MVDLKEEFSVNGGVWPKLTQKLCLIVYLKILHHLSHYMIEVGKRLGIRHTLIVDDVRLV